MAANDRKKQQYPRKSIIDRAFKAFEERGLEIGSFAISPDGTVRIGTPSSDALPNKDEFQAWDDEGRL